MATFDLGRVTPIYKGDYSASASYELNDVVLYDGNLYWHHKPTATVGVLPTDTTVWGVVFTDEGVRAEIRGYADNAQASANSAQASKSAAATSASNASASASQAALSAQTATDKATLASQKASEASASASTASEAKTAAINNAQLSVAKADEARNSATQAANSATSAQEYDESAQQSAVNAQASATNAAASEAAAKRYAEDSAAYLGAYPTDTAEGEIASFSDGADDVPVKSLVVDIDPVQDLHGYENPWPAGGGKNLCSVNEMTVTGYESQSIVEIPAGSYTLSMNLTSTDTSATTCFVRFLNSSDAPVASVQMDRGTGVTRRIAFGESVVKILIFASSNAADSSGETATATNIQIELGTTATAFAPYSNICPITGWTGAKINKSGINIWDEETELGNVSSTTGAKFNANNRIRTKNYIPVVPGTQYKIVFPMAETIGTLAYYDSGKNFVSAIFPSANAVITAPSNAYYMLIGFATGYGVTYNHDISINYPSTDTAYHPYSGESVDISFPTEAGTVYGGTLDVTTGKLTVTKGFIQSYNGEALPGVWISDMDVYAQGATPTTGAEVCYNLTTPITYQLTPTEVKSLLGQNNIWNDTGDTTVEYRADTSAYIAKKIAEAISALS